MPLLRMLCDSRKVRKMWIWKLYTRLAVTIGLLELLSKLIMIQRIEPQTRETSYLRERVSIYGNSEAFFLCACRAVMQKAKSSTYFLVAFSTISFLKHVALILMKWGWRWKRLRRRTIMGRSRRREGVQSLFVNWLCHSVFLFICLPFTW